MTAPRGSKTLLVRYGSDDSRPRSDAVDHDVSREREVIAQRLVRGAHPLFPAGITELDRPSQRQPFEVDARSRDVPEIFDRDWSHAKAPLVLGSHQTLRRQSGQCLPHRTEADAESPGEKRNEDLLARFQSAGQDLGSHVGQDRARQASDRLAVGGQPERQPAGTAHVDSARPLPPAHRKRNSVYVLQPKTGATIAGGPASLSSAKSIFDERSAIRPPSGRDNHVHLREPPVPPLPPLHPESPRSRRFERRAGAGRGGVVRRGGVTRWSRETTKGLRSSRNPLSCWSGRPDSNRRRPAWEAGILPLNYGRPATPILQRPRRRYLPSLSDMVNAWSTSSLRAFQLSRLATP